MSPFHIIETASITLYKLYTKRILKASLGWYIANHQLSTFREQFLYTNY